jgi:hypothetical protein
VSYCTQQTVPGTCVDGRMTRLGDAGCSHNDSLQLVGRGVPEGTRVACSFQPVCERRAHTIPPRRIGSVKLMTWHVPPAETARRIPEDISTASSPGCGSGVSPSRYRRAPDSFIKKARRVQKHRLLHLFGELIQWVDTARYLGDDSIRS